jgi:redox-sensitive bicupin YhaK (pirin superfamily)
MKAIVHPAQERGHANHGWLDSYHSFSFAGYYNPSKIHFGALRVLNDDKVAAGMGFGTHPHDNMEIVSIPLSGDLHHKDSTGRDKIIKQGDVQIMSAGSGIEHSEQNANRDKEVKFLQIWVFPKEKNIEPRYDQKSFAKEDRLNKWQTVVSPNEDSALWINQDAWFTLGTYQKEKTATYNLHQKNGGVYVFVIEGEINIGGQTLNSRDAIGIWETETINIKAGTDTELLLIEVPMQFKA